MAKTHNIGSLDRKRIFKIWKEHFHKLVCAYCLQDVTKDAKSCSPKFATLDHIKPTSIGGKQGSLENIVVACWTCNRSKSDKENVEPVYKFVKSCKKWNVIQNIEMYNGYKPIKV